MYFKTHAIIYMILPKISRIKQSHHREGEYYNCTKVPEES